MFTKLKLWLARRELANALKHEEQMRESAKFVRDVVLPHLERQIEKLELADVLARQERLFK